MNELLFAKNLALGVLVMSILFFITNRMFEETDVTKVISLILLGASMIFVLGIFILLTVLVLGGGR